MTDQNKKLAKFLSDISAMYQFKGGDNPFRALAYRKAAKAVSNLPKNITDYLKDGQLNKIPGIGESIEKDVLEFIKTGDIARYEALKKEVPYDLIEMMDIRGFGPKSLNKIHKELHYKTKEEIIDALKGDKISKLKGFGAKKLENMQRGLKAHKTIENRMLLSEALLFGEKIISSLKKLPEVKNIELAGSLRRRKETIGDIDILISAKQKDRKKITDYFTSSQLAAKILAKGDTKASILLKENNRQVDLRIVEEDEWGAALQYFTGSKEHNIHLRTMARDKGYKISEYGIFDIKQDTRKASKTEEDIYNTLDLQLIPPEMREDKGELDLAAQYKIPILVAMEDIKGDLQMHSNWSDGLQTLEELANYVIQHFSYDFIAITDHSKSSRIAGGLTDKEFLKQIEAIKEVNRKIGKSFLKAGAEVDILSDGTMDLSDEVLEQLDWVTASIHSGFNHDNTDRIIKACRHPHVHCIGHPTGRLIGKREAYPVSIDKLIEAAKETGTLLEINAQPDRLDLNDEMAFLARKAGVKLVISTDSHRPEDFHNMRLGVYVARRAWCTKDDILNTRSWQNIEQIISKKSVLV